MQVLVILIARHQLALKTFEDHGDHLIKNEKTSGLADVGASLLARTFNPKHAKNLSFEQFITQGGVYDSQTDTPHIEGVVVLYERPLGYLLNDIRNAIFAAEIPSIGYIENVRNFLIGHFSTLLRNYGVLIRLAHTATANSAISLPIRNFDAQELRDLSAICKTKSLEETFQNEIVPSLTRLLKLRGPKRRSSYPDLYFKDACSRYYRYGHERHSRYETGGSHNLACLVNGLFRFGIALDQERHFNVTVGDSNAPTLISTNLPNCHNHIVRVKNRTHINMFSNDFHK